MPLHTDTPPLQQLAPLSTPTAANFRSIDDINPLSDNDSDEPEEELSPPPPQPTTHAPTAPDHPAQSRLANRTENRKIKPHDKFNTMTLNCRTLAYSRELPTTTSGCNHSALEELVLYLDEQHVRYCAIQEHKITRPPNPATTYKETPEDSTPIYTQSHKDWTFYYTLATLTDTHAVTGGVGFLLHNRYAEHINTITSVTPRIIDLRLDDTIHILSIYAPTAASPIQQTIFYDVLSHHISAIPARRTLLAHGDFNAILRQNDSGPFGHRKPLSKLCQGSNALLVELLRKHQLAALDTLQSKPNYYTFMSTTANHTHRKVPLDHLLVRKPDSKFLQTFLDCKPPIHSDHRAVIFKLALHPRYTKTQKQQRPPKLNYAAITKSLNAKHSKGTTPLHEQLAREMEDQLQSRVNPANPLTIDDYDILTNAINTAARKTLDTHKPVRRTNVATHNDTLAARKCYMDADASDPQTLRIAFRELLATKRKLRDDDINHLCTQFETLHKNDPLLAYHHVRAATYKPTESTQVKAKDNDERKSLIAGTCAKQLNNTKGDPTVTYDEIPTDLQYDAAPFTVAEVLEISRKLPNNKAIASGGDQIANELLKIPAVAERVTQIFNDAFAKGKNPTMFRYTEFAMIPKPGMNHSQPEAWRYIALMSHVTKLYDKLLGARIIKVIDPHLRQNQNGFRKNRNTLQHCYAYQAIRDIYLLKDKPLVQLFIDFKSAFPSVRWFAIVAALKAWKVPQQLLDAIMSVYYNHKCKVNTTDGLTGEFDISAGVLQGDTLAPFLFVLVLDCILRKTIDTHTTSDNKPAGVPLTDPSTDITTYCADLDYADDIVLFSHTRADMQTLLTKITTESLRAGLECNVKKTKFIHTGALIPNDLANITLLGGNIEQVQSYRYLGIWTDIDQDLTERIGRAWTAARKYSKVWRSTVHRTTKIRLAQTCVFPVLMYGASAYTWTTKREDKIRGAYTRLLQYVTNDPYHNRVPLYDLYTYTTKKTKHNKAAHHAIPLPKTQAVTHFDNLTRRLYDPIRGSNQPVKAALAHLLSLRVKVGRKKTPKRRIVQTLLPTLATTNFTLEEGIPTHIANGKRTINMNKLEQAQHARLREKSRRATQLSLPREMLTAITPHIVSTSPEAGLKTLRKIVLVRSAKHRTQMVRFKALMATLNLIPFHWLLKHMMPTPLSIPKAIHNDHLRNRPDYIRDTQIPRIFHVQTTKVTPTEFQHLASFEQHFDNTPVLDTSSDNPLWQSTLVEYNSPTPFFFFFFEKFDRRKMVFPLP